MGEPGSSKQAKAGLMRKLESTHRITLRTPDRDAIVALILERRQHCAEAPHD